MDSNFLKAAEAVYSNNGSQAVVADPVVPAAENQASAEIAVDTPANAAQNPVNEPSAVAEGSQPTISNEPYNYWEDLAQKTDGLIKDEETFNGILEKSKNYDQLAQEKAEWEKNQFKPANDYVAKFNEIILAGASPDQVKAFVKLNEYGALEDLSPTDVKVARMVLLEGYSEKVARDKVDMQFDFAQFDETDPLEKMKLDILKEDLRVAAKSDLEALKDYRKDLSVVNNPDKENAEKAHLQEIANISTYNKTVDAEAPKIAKNFPTKLSYDLKIGDETVKFEDSIDQDFLDKELPGLVADYFKDSMDPVNQENISKAYSYAYGEYLKANDQKRLEKAYNKGLTEGTERTVNKYENRSGLPRHPENTLTATNEDALTAFQKKLLGKK